MPQKHVLAARAEYAGRAKSSAMIRLSPNRARTSLPKPSFDTDNMLGQHLEIRGEAVYQPTGEPALPCDRVPRDYNRMSSHNQDPAAIGSPSPGIEPVIPKLGRKNHFSLIFWHSGEI